MSEGIYKHGKGYAIVYRAHDPATGKVKQIWKTYPTKAAAVAARKAAIAEVDAGTWTRASKQTLAEYLTDDWLPSLDAAVAGGSLKASAAAFYRNLANAYVIPRLGGTMLNRLDAPTLNKLYGELLVTGKRAAKSEGDGPPPERRPLSRTTVHGVHVTISRALGDAVKWGRISRNVAKLAEPPQPANEKREVWDAEQLRQFAASVEGDRLAAMWRLAMTTGLRRGEIAGLAWSAIDLDAAKLRVSAARVVVNYAVIDETPKSKASERVIGLDPATVLALRQHRRRQLEDRMAWQSAGWVDSGLVFTRENGTGYHPEYLTRTFQAAAKRAGLPVIPLHALRHSYATAGLEAGVPMKVMQERLGHSSLAITSDLYSHVRPQIDQDAADKTAAYIFGE